MKKQIAESVKKRISQVYLDYPVGAGVDGETVNIVIPLDQVILPASEDKAEENLSALVWKIVPAEEEIKEE